MDEIVIIAAEKSNETKTDLSGKAERKIRDACLKEGSMIHMVTLEGTPIRAFSYHVDYKASGITKGKQEQLASEFTDEIIGAASSVQAKTPEVDIAKAIRLGASCFEIPDAKKTMIISSSLISTVGDIDVEKTINYDPKEVADILKSNKCLPELTGVKVMVVSCGGVVSPQKEIPSRELSELKEQYREIFMAAGADSIEFVDAFEREKPDKTLPKVTPITFNQEELFGVISFSEDDGLEFIGDSSSLKEKSKKLLVENVLPKIKAYEGDILICGTTATGDATYTSNLSISRAEAIRAIIKEAGASNNLICIGLGCKNEYHVDDVDEGGNLIEEKARLNRSVIILSADSIEGQKLIEKYDTY